MYEYPSYHLFLDSCEFFFLKNITKKAVKCLLLHVYNYNVTIRVCLSLQADTKCTLEISSIFCDFDKYDSSIWTFTICCASV